MKLLTFTIILIVCIGIVLGIAALFGMAVHKGYEYNHTVDPLPEEDDTAQPAKKADTL
ncbi:YtzI protein [Halobacillus litoralis]|uniref:YtzI protein n=1 Tax=Halobacillus litoralis TaxID=45668 RepID=UPI001CD58A48|nr:YtzI protein [Halobacillus litoralis]MCA1021354.1 YtzI protein [Halobacillus litoralis]